MLDSLRSFATTWLGKVLGAFLLVGLAGFGISGVLTGIGSDTVARVGSAEITTRDFQRAYNAQLNATAQRMGTLPTPEQAMALGVPSAALNQLANDAVLDTMGAEFGLGASDAQLGKMLREDPNFAGLLGNFDAENFQRVLQQNGFTENEYLAAQTKAVRRQQIITAIFGGAKLPETAQNLVSRYSADTRAIDYFVLNDAALLPPAEPTEAEMAAYLEENQADYRTVPTRDVKVMVLSPEAIAAGITLTDDEIAAEYERTKASFIRTETRDVQQVVLATDDLVKAFEDGMAAGTPFDQLVTENGLTVTNLGTLTEAAITDKTLATAAFSLDEGAIELIPGALGQRAISVSNIVPGGQESLEEVRDEVAERLKLKQARDSYIDVLDQIEELRAAFRPLDEIAGRYDLTLTDVPVTATGEALDTVEAIPAESRTRVASAIFAADQGDLAPTVALSSTLNVWFDIERIEDARDQTLDEVRDTLFETMMQERIETALAEQVEGIVQRLDDGEDFADVAVSLNQFPQLSQPFTRRGDGSPVIDQNVAAAAFDGGADHYGSARNAEGDYVVFTVDSVNPADPEITEQTRDFINNAMLDSLYGDFVTALRTDAGIRINQNVLGQVLGLDGTQ